MECYTVADVEEFLRRADAEVFARTGIHYQPSPAWTFVLPCRLRVSWVCDGGHQYHSLFWEPLPEYAWREVLEVEV